MSICKYSNKTNVIPMLLLKGMRNKRILQIIKQKHFKKYICFKIFYHFFQSKFLLFVFVFIFEECEMQKESAITALFEMKFSI